jgi:hypothetical protein
MLICGSGRKNFPPIENASRISNHVKSGFLFRFSLSLDSPATIIMTIKNRCTRRFVVDATIRRSTIPSDFIKGKVLVCIKIYVTCVMASDKNLHKSLLASPIKIFFFYVFSRRSVDFLRVFFSSRIFLIEKKALQVITV